MTPRAVLLVVLDRALDATPRRLERTIAALLGAAAALVALGWALGRP